MKNYYLTIFLILMTSGIFAQYDSIPYDGDYRTYLLHLPSGYTGISDLPLIVAMHGGFGNAYSMETISELSIKADAEHFIVVYPEGVKGGFLNASSWNAGWCCGFASSSNVDDVGFIDSLLNTLIGDYSIDTNRIYATGMSNGGFMSYRLACELSDRIAAIAPVECSMTMTSCTPNRVVPIIHFHSYLDTHIPYDGGIGSGPSNHYNPPIDSVLNVWASNNSCGILNDTIINNAQYTLTKWTDCDCETEIHCYITQDGGHSWPGVGGSAYINATDLMWTFFQQYSLDCNPTFIANENRQESKIKIYPNPTNNIIKIQPYINWKNIKISVFSPQGQEILRSIDQTEVDISNLSNGLLLMKIELDDTVEMHIILKTK